MHGTAQEGRPDPAATAARLAAINLDDLVSSLGWQDRPLLAGISRRLLRRAAQKFAHQIAEFDSAVGQHGLVSASRRTLVHYVRDVRVFGRERIPAGPFLALANHPGMTDALSLIGALNRPDLLIIASRRPFLEALPHTSKRLSCLSDDPSSPAGVVRTVGAHLRRGGAAMSFPAGRIEPDPDIHDGAAESLKSWAQSADAFARLAPETAILPVLIRGVVWANAAHGWTMHRNRTATDRDKAAAALQLLAHIVLKVRPVSVRLQIGRPLCARDLGTTTKPGLHQAVVAEMSMMIGNPPDGEGERLS